MYFIITSAAKIALKDIVCWKMVYPEKGTRKVYRSAHFAFPYRTGQTYTKIEFTRRLEDYPTLEGKSQGFHSLVHKPRPRRVFHTQVRLECIIPTGSWYFTDGQFYFSERIKIVRRV